VVMLHSPSAPEAHEAAPAAPTVLAGGSPAAWQAEPAGREERLFEAFVATAAVLAEDFDPVAQMRDLAARCAGLARADAATVMLADDEGRLQPLVSWPDRRLTLEPFTDATLAGPHHECFRTAAAVAQPDLSLPDRRWPQFAVRAMDAGFQSVYALPMRLRCDTLGVVSLLCTGPAGVSDLDLRICGALANAAAISLLQERVVREHELAARQIRAALDMLSRPGLLLPGQALLGGEVGARPTAKVG
jgi:GAF domain